MLEERGGWISGGAQRHDVKMTDAVIELMVEAIKDILGDNLNPFKKKIGEILPLDLKKTKKWIFSEEGCNYI